MLLSYAENKWVFRNLRSCRRAGYLESEHSTEQQHSTKFDIFANKTCNIRKRNIESRSGNNFAMEKQ
jgi:hypothetical protein